MIAKRIFFILLGVAWFTGAGAQVLKTDSTKREKGTTEVIVFSQDAYHPPASTGAYLHPEKHNANVVKVGLIYFVSGNIPFYYERRIFPWLSAQVGLGLTTRDFVADVANLILTEGGDNTTEFSNTSVYNHIYSNYADYSNRKARVGVYASLQPKFYIHNDALDGFYLSPMAEFKRYNYRAQLVDETQVNVEAFLPNSYMNEYRNAIDFTFNIGWQWLFNPLEVEFSMGGGFRRFWESRLDIAQLYSTDTYVNGVRNYNGYRPEFNVALDFGGFF